MLGYNLRKAGKSRYAFPLVIITLLTISISDIRAQKTLDSSGRYYCFIHDYACVYQFYLRQLSSLSPITLFVVLRSKIGHYFVIGTIRSQIYLSSNPVEKPIRNPNRVIQIHRKNRSHHPSNGKPLINPGGFFLFLLQYQHNFIKIRRSVDDLSEVLILTQRIKCFAIVFHNIDRQQISIQLIV